jgi:hypothetical protein
MPLSASSICRAGALPSWSQHYWQTIKGSGDVLQEAPIYA